MKLWEQKREKETCTKSRGLCLPLINICPQFPRCSSHTQLFLTEEQMPLPAVTTRLHPKLPPMRPEGVNPVVIKKKIKERNYAHERIRAMPHAACSISYLDLTCLNCQQLKFLNKSFIPTFPFFRLNLAICVNILKRVQGGQFAE